MEENTILDAAKAATDTSKSFLGWYTKPHEEARDYLVKIINQNENLSDEEKTAMIWHSRKIVREAKNVDRIVALAKEKVFNSSNAPKKDKNSHKKTISEDWLNMFFEKAKDISDGDTQYLWAAALAKEYVNPGSITRALLHILYIIDFETAGLFSSICSYSVLGIGKDRPFQMKDGAAAIPIIDTYKHNELFVKCGLTGKKLDELDSLGIIKYNYLNPPRIGLGQSYFLYGKNILFVKSSQDFLERGTVTLTDKGSALFDIFKQEVKSDCLEYFKEFWISKGYSVQLTSLANT